MKTRGFLLIEALIAISVLSVAVVSLLGGVSQGLHLANRAEDTTKAVLQMDGLLFQLESGLRSDLAVYGGRGNFEAQYQYEVASEPHDEILRAVRSKLSWGEGHRWLELDMLIPEWGGAEL